MKFLVPALSTLLSLNAFSYDLIKTEAASALNVLKLHRDSAGNNMPLTVEEGADIAYVCMSLQYKSWGQPIYQSILANKDALVPVQMNDYVNYLDKVEKSFQIVEAGREGLITLVSENIQRFQQDKKLPSTPEGLSFSNFKNESNNYLTALNYCGEQEFLDTVLSQLDSVDASSVIKGGFAVTAPTQINIGYIHYVSSGAIVAGNMCTRDCGGQPTILNVTDKAPIFDRTKSYENWINTFNRM